MMIFAVRSCALIGILSTAFVTSLGIAQTNIVVEDGEVLGENELLNGYFMGQVFDLGPGTTFDINFGGVIGPTPSFSEQNPFDFGGSILNLNNGGQFSAFLQPSSYLSNMVMNAESGSVAFNMNMIGVNSILNLNGGALFLGSAVSGSTINMSSGTIGTGYLLSGGSALNMAGGSVTGLLDIDTGSTVTISGGNLGRNSRVLNMSTLTLFDGVVGEGLHSSEESTINIYGGEVGDRFRPVSSTVNISGGLLGDHFDAIASSVSITGGRVGDNFLANINSDVWISGGVIGNNFTVGTNGGTGTVVDVSGGTIGDQITVRSTGAINISGGNIGDEFRAFSGGETNLFVTEISIDGIDLELVPNEEYVISTRGGALLEAILEDGSFLDFTLNDLQISGEDLFANNSLLTVTFIPGPGVGVFVGLAGLLVSRRRRG